MCPACFTTVALVAAGASSAGGLAALLATKVRGKAAPKTPRESDGRTLQPLGERTDDDDAQDRHT